jgi:hypothetical protein
LILKSSQQLTEQKEVFQSTPAPAKVEEREIVPSEEKVNYATNGDGGEIKRSARLTTARRRPPKVNEGANEVQAKDIAPVATKKAEGIIFDGANDDVSQTVIITIKNVFLRKYI